MTDSDFLEAALEGLLIQKSRIEHQIQEVRRLLGRRPASQKVLETPPGSSPVKRQLSPAARKRIAAAQKRRWAEYRKTSNRKAPASAES